MNNESSVPLAAPPLTWLHGNHAPLTCRWCGYSGSGQEVAAFDSALGQHIARRCPTCRSLDLMDANLPSSPTHGDVDDYAEVGCGVGTLASLVDLALTYATPRDEAAILDVGCSYGIGLDYARWRTGWKALGIEPSLAGSRGHSDLDLEILVEPLTAATDLADRTFDVIVCSEVLEHVEEPRELARLLVSLLAPEGVLLLTTPDAEVVTPGQSDEDAAIAVSHGYHVALASLAGLRRVLDEVGLDIQAVGRASVSHVVVARRGSAGPPGEAAVTEPADLEAYLVERAAQFAVGSPVGLGLAARAFRTAVAQGDFPLAHELLPDLELRSKTRYGRGIEESVDSPTGHPAGGPFHGVLFARGMMFLLENQPARAVLAFEAAQVAIRDRRAAGFTFDHEMQQLVWDVEFHRALALAMTNPAEAANAALRFADDMPHLHENFLRVFIHLVNGGALDEATLLVGGASSLVAADIETRQIDRVTSLDALYSLGALATQRGDTGDADRWLRECIEACGSEPRTPHQAGLVEACKAMLASFDHPGREQPHGV